MKIGTYVVDKEDTDKTDPAIVVHNDIEYSETNIIKRADGHMST